MKHLLLVVLAACSFVGLRAEESVPDNRTFARQVAAGGIVLLQNEDNVLPLAKDEEVALMGVTSYYCHRMGWGSGDMMSRPPVQYAEGLKQAGVRLQPALAAFFDKKPANYDRVNKDWAKWTARFEEPWGNVSSADFAKICGTNRAMKCLVTIGRNSGEAADILPGYGGWMLDGQEERLVKEACANFDNVIVLLNVGGPIDLSWLDAYPVKGVVLTSMLGEVSGLAVADVLTGKVNPSGRLAATWARRYRDYPTTDCFGTVEVPFNEGVYVGYRYFDSFGVAPRFPFGYGLSYTRFTIKPTQLQLVDGTCVEAHVVLNNVGACCGSEVVQCYVSAPDGANVKPYQQLAAFASVENMKVGETRSVTLRFDLTSLASFCEKTSSWILDAGTYVVRVGFSSRNTAVAGVFEIEKPVVVEKCAKRCAPPANDLSLIAPTNRPDRLADAVVRAAKRPVFSTAAIKTADHSADYPKAETLTARGSVPWSAVVAGTHSVADFVAQLSDVELASVVNGALMDEVGTTVGGVTGVGGSYSGAVSCEAAETWSSAKYGVPPMTCADGPSGVRLGNFGDPASKYNPKYAEMFHWPCGTALAQTWNPALALEMGRRVRVDMESAGIHGWLAPGLNIQRNPLCGRNFEYYSEDPLVAGLMGAAICLGVEGPADKFSGRHVTIKHFAVNSQETDRSTQNNVVSERALREIYLRPFEIAVKEGHPSAVMTSYNKVNGEFSATNYDLQTGILRAEWGFDGMVMTDWWNAADNTRHQKAGNDLIMPGVKDKRNLIARGLADGTIDRAEVQRSAVRILELVRRCTGSTK